jgi:hypothetical protein
MDMVGEREVKLSGGKDSDSLWLGQFTLACANYIYVIENGCLAEEGTHEKHKMVYTVNFVQSRALNNFMGGEDE